MRQALSTRGFFTDTRAFRHLPELLALLGRDDELAGLTAPDFMARAVAGLQPPAAVAHTLTFLARHHASRCDWPRLVQCVELRRAFDTYESEGLSGTLVTYSGVLVALLGAEAVATSLLYDGLPTVSPRWGLLLCEAVDRAGTAAPWEAYLTAWEDTRDNDNTHYGEESDGQVLRAELRGRLRLPRHRHPDDVSETDDHTPLPERIAKFLSQDGLSDLPEVLDVVVDCLGAEALFASVPLISSSAVRSAVLLRLAELSATAGRGLPSPRILAVAAWACSSDEAPGRLLRLGVPLVEISEELFGQDRDATLRAATDEAVRYPQSNFERSVRRWLNLVSVAYECDRQAPRRLLPQLEGPGFFRAWMRFVVNTVGLRTQVESGALAPGAASAAVRVALKQLAESSDAFTGKPRACDLWYVNRLVQEVIHDAVSHLDRVDLEPAISSLTSIGESTTTSLSGMSVTGPLVTTDLLAMLSRTVDRTGAAVVHRLMQQLRDRHAGHDTLYPERADFELEMARVNLTAGDPEEARRCWERSARYMAAYGSHKDATIFELLDSLPDLAAADHRNTLGRLARTQPLTYLVRRHTDGRSTSDTPEHWWRILADLDPRAAADLAARTLLTEPGVPDSHVEATLHRLLKAEAATADPVILAALRITAGSGKGDIGEDTALLHRLAELPPGDPAHGGEVLARLADAVTATYDDGMLTYALGAQDTAMDLRAAARRLGGQGVSPQRASRSSDSSSASGRKFRTTADVLVAQQPPQLLPGAHGAIAAVRGHSRRSYKGSTGAGQSIDALADAVGWRVMEVFTLHGVEAAVKLLHRLAEEIGPFDATELLPEVAEGLSLRRAIAPEPLGRLAAIAYTLAFATTRGGGGWLTMAGRDRLDLWRHAQQLDATAAEQCLAHQVAETVAGRYYGTLGVTQALVAAFVGGFHSVERPGVDDARACWDAACSVIAFRLPGTMDLRAGAYHPGPDPASQGDVDLALAQLALSTLAQPERADRRRALVAASVLLAARPTHAQTPIARVLAAGLGAGPLSWLLDVLQCWAGTSPVQDDLADQLTKLARSDMLSVRVGAARILVRAGRPVPDVPATDAHPALLRAVAPYQEVDRG